jgi:hypothetical protein
MGTSQFQFVAPRPDEQRADYIPRVYAETTKTGETVYGLFNGKPVIGRPHETMGLSRDYYLDLLEQRWQSPDIHDVWEYDYGISYLMLEPADAHLLDRSRWIKPRWLNRTPHAIHYHTPESAHTFLPYGEPIRIRHADSRQCFSALLHADFRICHIVSGRPIHDPVALPEPEFDTYHIVSRMVAEAYPNRRDLVFPDQLLRNDSGDVVGCSAFGQVPYPKFAGRP